MLTSNQKGAVAETAIIHAATRLGVGVLKPVADERYDLVFDLRPRLVRVQCKWAVRLGPVVSIRCYSCRRTANGLRKRSYTADEVDALAAYCLELDRCFLVPAGRIAERSEVRLRLAPPLNSQRSGVNWAAEYDLAATLGRQLLGP
ncbi:MAG: hypothetical protein H0V40_09760 [Actinobacteria bacterium]|nr:hypothetical protein [Actinomycetota bacterium]